MERSIFYPGIAVGCVFFGLGALCAKGMVDDYPAFRCFSDASRSADERFSCEAGYSSFGGYCLFTGLFLLFGLFTMGMSVCCPPFRRKTPDEQQLERLLMTEASVV